MDGARLALINGRVLAEKTLVQPNIILRWLTRRNSSIKSLQRDAIAGHSYGPMLNLGGVSRVAAEHRCLQQRIEVRLAGKNY